MSLITKQTKFKTHEHPTKFCGETECFSQYKIDIKNKIKEELDNDYH